jgi:hypothetical protein
MTIRKGLGSSQKISSLKAVKASNRRVGSKYLDTKGREGIWDGNILRCPHNKMRYVCKECGGSSICEHGRERSKCKDCEVLKARVLEEERAQRRLAASTALPVTATPAILLLHVLFADNVDIL